MDLLTNPDIQRKLEVIKTNSEHNKTVNKLIKTYSSLTNDDLRNMLADIYTFYKGPGDSKKASDNQRQM